MLRIFLYCFIFVITVAQYRMGSDEYDYTSLEFEQTSSGVVQRPWSRSSESSEVSAGKLAFINYIQKYGKKYRTKGIRRNAYANFLVNLADVEAHNSQPNVTFTKRLYMHSDRSKDDFIRLNTGFKLTTAWNAIPTDGPLFDKPAPVSLDDTKFLQPIQNQMLSTSSYAYAPVAALEAYIKMFFNINKKLSEQQIIDCSDNTTCGTYDQFIDYIRKYGIMTASAYKSLRGSKCTKAQGKITFGNMTVNGYRMVANNDRITKNALFNVGPTTICVDASGWSHYNGGIYPDLTSGNMQQPQCNHAATLVGYGTANEIPFYLLRNSWGKLINNVPQQSELIFFSRIIVG